MKYSIDLEPPFAYSAYWYAIGLGLILLAILLRWLFNWIFKRKVESPLRADKLYRETMQQIDNADQSYRNRQLDLRTLHQKLSKEVRQYVQKMDGLRAQSMVYDELCRKARPDLADLIGDYYGPEFAYAPQADAAASVAKAKSLVDELYQRVLKEKGINRAGRVKTWINDVLGRLLRIAPKFAAPAVLTLVKGNSIAWVQRIEKAAEKGNLDSYSVRGQSLLRLRARIDSPVKIIHNGPDLHSHTMRRLDIGGTYKRCLLPCRGIKEEPRRSNDIDARNICCAFAECIVRGL